MAQQKTLLTKDTWVQIATAGQTVSFYTSSRAVYMARSTAIPTIPRLDGLLVQHGEPLIDMPAGAGLWMQAFYPDSYINVDAV
jgi:hypothetical protein